MESQIDILKKKNQYQTDTNIHTYLTLRWPIWPEFHVSLETTSLCFGCS